jgi:hypothetical protein
LLFPTRQIWVATGPLKRLRIELGLLALFQYNKFTVCLFPSRPKDLFRDVQAYGKRNAATFQPVFACDVFHVCGTYVAVFLAQSLRCDLYDGKRTIGEDKETTANNRRHRLQLSNVDKILYPGGRFTKMKVIDYYIRGAPFLLPLLKNPPCHAQALPRWRERRLLL